MLFVQLLFFSICLVSTQQCLVALILARHWGKDSLEADSRLELTAESQGQKHKNWNLPQSTEKPPSCLSFQCTDIITCWPSASCFLFLHCGAVWSKHLVSTKCTSTAHQTGIWEYFLPNWLNVCTKDQSCIFTSLMVWPQSSRGLSINCRPIV